MSDKNNIISEMEQAYDLIYKLYNYSKQNKFTYFHYGRQNGKTRFVYDFINNYFTLLLSYEKAEKILERRVKRHLIKTKITHKLKKLLNKLIV